MYLFSQLVMGRIRIVVSTPRCGRGNLSSNLRCDTFLQRGATQTNLFIYAVADEVADKCSVDHDFATIVRTRNS